jgi:3-hydroxyacyl-[acyl-carrier-protein] dehydratase
MPPQAIIELSKIDLNHVIATREEIEKLNAQRFEMSQLDGIVHLDEAARIVVGYKDVRDDEFWVRGHIPGRPLLPGVLMIEAAAQLVSYYVMRTMTTDRFLGFGGVDGVKFRDTVAPGDRLVLMTMAVDVRPRRIISIAQGYVGAKMVFEGTITGMPV